MYVKRQLKLRRKEDLRGVKASLVFSLSLLVCIAYYAYHTLMNYGVAGQFPVLPTGSALFLSIWTLVTCFIIVVWGARYLTYVAKQRLLVNLKCRTTIYSDHLHGGM